MILWQTWWAWAAFGLLLAIAEVLAPGYVFLGFAMGAGAVAAGLLLTPWLVPGALAPVLLVWAVLSLLAWVALRQWLGSRRGQVKRWDRDIND